MHTSNHLLDSPIVLSLNRAWQVIGHRTVRQAITAMTGGEAGLPPATGIDISYPKTDSGWSFDTPLYLSPVKWDEWMGLPVRDFDLSIATAKQRIRVPTVIVATHFADMPMTQPRLSREAILQRDGGVCQFTGEYVGREGGNLDHVVPVARGGRNAWGNLVWAKRSVNTAKGARLPHEAGLRLLRTPKAPPRVPISALLREAKHPDWVHFLH